VGFLGQIYSYLQIVRRIFFKEFSNYFTTFLSEDFGNLSKNYTKKWIFYYIDFYEILLKIKRTIVFIMKIF
jgi:hypothetical protein